MNIFFCFSGGILGLAYVGSPRRNSVGGICTPEYFKNGYTLYLNSGLSSSRNHYGQRVITREAGKFEFSFIFKKKMYITFYLKFEFSRQIWSLPMNLVIIGVANMIPTRMNAHPPPVKVVPTSCIPTLYLDMM